MKIEINSTLSKKNTNDKHQMVSKKMSAIFPQNVRKSEFFINSTTFFIFITRQILGTQDLCFYFENALKKSDLKSERISWWCVTREKYYSNSNLPQSNSAGKHLSFDVKIEHIFRYSSDSSSSWRNHFFSFSFWFFYIWQMNCIPLPCFILISFGSDTDNEKCFTQK